MTYISKGLQYYNVGETNTESDGCNNLNTTNWSNADFIVSF